MFRAHDRPPSSGLFLKHCAAIESRYSWTQVEHTNEHVWNTFHGSTGALYTQYVRACYDDDDDDDGGGGDVLTDCTVITDLILGLILG